MAALFMCAGTFLSLLTTIAILYGIVGVLTVKFVFLPDMPDAHLSSRVAVFILWPAVYLFLGVIAVYHFFADHQRGRALRLEGGD